MKTAEGIVKLNSNAWSDVGVAFGTTRFNFNVVSSVPEDLDLNVS